MFAMTQSAFSWLLASLLVCISAPKALSADRYSVVLAYGFQTLSAKSSTFNYHAYIGDQKTGSVFSCGYIITYTIVNNNSVEQVNKIGGCARVTAVSSDNGVFSFAPAAPSVPYFQYPQLGAIWRLDQDKGVVAFCLDHSNFVPAPEMECDESQLTN
jgi:hypothetical protein